MTDPIDFTDFPMSWRAYGGANGKKDSIIYDGEEWMLKFPAHARRNKDMSYAHGTVSEHLGSSIFNQLGIEAQKTLLGTCKRAGKVYQVVACKDFTAGGWVLQDFASLKNRVHTSTSKEGHGTDLAELLEAIEGQDVIDPGELRRFFWDMFIADALIGNWDRHNGNWGLLYHPDRRAYRIAPVFDCGSALFPQADEEMMLKALEDPSEIDLRVYERPLAALLVNGKKIGYFDFISSGVNDDCTEALARIAPRFDAEAVSALIADLPEDFASPVHRRFLERVIQARFDRILAFSHEKLLGVPPKTRERGQRRPISLRLEGVETGRASDAFSPGFPAGGR